MSEFKNLLKEYFSDPEITLAARELGPVKEVGHCFQSDDSWQVICTYPGDDRVEHRVNCGELMGWMWAKMKPMINSAS
jgi:hypothetical protein